MTQKDKKLLLKDLSARLPYETKVYWANCNYGDKIKNVVSIDIFGMVNDEFSVEECKPYLRPMSSMTEEEAREIAILHGYNPIEILSTKVTDEYIDIILDDCVSSTITSTIRYDEIISSLECFDYLNKKMFDFRGLIPKDLAISTEEFNPYKH